MYKHESKSSKLKMMTKLSGKKLEVTFLCDEKGGEID